LEARAEGEKVTEEKKEGNEAGEARVERVEDWVIIRKRFDIPS
jgi:hypothetical protein